VPEINFIASRGDVKIEADDLPRVAARLYYIDGLDEHAVAELLDVSRPTVSRLLSQARARGIVRFSVEDYEPRNTVMEQELRERFHLKNVLVIKPVTTRPSLEIVKTLGYFAAPLVEQWIHHGSIVGVAGGRSLAQLVRSLPLPGEPQNLTTVQLMGNIGPTVSSMDAIELCRVLAQKLGGSLYSLNAPAFAPDETTRAAFQGHDHIRSVWRLFEQMDIALVGVGTLSNSAFIERGVLDAASLAVLKARGAVGEICGRFFDAAGQECQSEFRQRVISIPLADLTRVGDVIGVTMGSQRAGAIVAALRGRILKSLVIDESGARAVLGQSD
jgi:deoxyribonucleoside regulator